MGRLILIILVVVLVLWLLRRALAAGKRQEPPGAGGGGAPELVACAHCGVNLPRSEARSAGGRHYCSEEHWRLGPRED
ncbi:MAG: hypothetical protein FJY43_03200 [Betaproteobacteria bacterium]|nr:hypothetical protein [Betaproteobacteria bacterium]